MTNPPSPPGPREDAPRPHRNDDQRQVGAGDARPPNGAVIDKLAWIHICNRRVLSTRSRGRDCYYIPGGKRELGESDLLALVREVREELSVDLDRATVEPFGVYTAQAHGHRAGIQVRMTCYQAAYHGELRAASEIEEVRWVTTADAHLCSPVDQIILRGLQARDLID